MSGGGGEGGERRLSALSLIANCGAPKSSHARAAFLSLTCENSSYSDASVASRSRSPTYSDEFWTGAGLAPAAAGAAPPSAAGAGAAAAAAGAAAGAPAAGAGAAAAGAGAVAAADMVVGVFWGGGARRDSRREEGWVEGRDFCPRLEFFLVLTFFWFPRTGFSVLYMGERGGGRRGGLLALGWERGRGRGEREGGLVKRMDEEEQGGGGADCQLASLLRARRRLPASRGRARCNQARAFTTSPRSTHCRSARVRARARSIDRSFACDVTRRGRRRRRQAPRERHQQD